MGFYPEGYQIDTAQNRMRIASIAALSEAAIRGDILEGRAIVCTAEHDLIVQLGDRLRGVIPHDEGAIGMTTGEVRDIALLSRVNKPVSFMVTGFDTIEGELVPLLSRRLAQEKCRREYLEKLSPGDVLEAMVTHLEPFGAFADIGCGISSLLPIDLISVSRISHPSDRFTVGQPIRAVVKAIDEQGRICLSHKELLGTWEENAALFAPGETVAGVVRSVEPYGIFVELTPNLAGLAEPREGIRNGDHASVYIKSLLPQKMKVKLVIIDAFPANYPPAALEYFEVGEHIDRWQYSPPGTARLVETVFG